MPTVDLAIASLRELNQQLHEQTEATNDKHWIILNPKGQHALAAGVDAPLDIDIEGHVGYYCGSMNKHARITVNGNAGNAVGGNMMSGRIHVKGDASQYAGATAHGGLLIIDGDASARCGISMKGVDIVVKGSVGHMSAFMGQAGRLVVLGDAGDALGDSLYETRIYLRGTPASLGADCIEKPMEEKHRQELAELLEAAGLAGEVELSQFRRYGSARNLYNFKVDNVSAY